MIANLQERELSELKDPGLCPVWWSDPLGFFVIMPRCEIVSQSEYDDADSDLFPFILEMKNKYSVEDKRDTFGKLNGRYVVVDYG